MELFEFSFDENQLLSYRFEPLPWSHIAKFNNQERADWYDSVQYSKNFKEDIDYLREQYPEVTHWDDIVLFEAWRDFCCAVYYANFLTPHRGHLFLAWLYDICEKYKQQSSNKDTLSDFNNSELIEAANRLWAKFG